MVIRGFFGGLIGLFLALAFTLLYLQLPENAGVFELFRHSDSLDILLIQSYSLPRITMALLAGGCLGFASLLLQQVMHNPLASDNTLGISAGAQFALFMMAIFSPHWLELGSTVVALLGAAVSLALVLGLAMRKTISPLVLILAGLVVNLYFGAFSAMMMLFYPEESRGLAQWGAGSLVQESWRDSQFLLWQAVPCGLITATVLRPLTILSLNENNAQSLGVPVTQLRLLGVGISAFLIASVVSHVGMIGFVGLAAATLVRQLGVRSLKHQLIGAFVGGALLLAITDLALQLFAQFTAVSLPTGAVTALLGTPLLLWLMFRAMPVGRLQEQAVAISRLFKPHYLWFMMTVFVVLCVLSLLLGRDNFSWALLSNFPIFELRLPRVLVAAAVGILLAVAGVLLQRLTLNPMASPELLGVSSGTSMGILVALFMFSVQSPMLLTLAGIAGAMIALLALMLINQRNGMLPEKVLLTGISLSALFDTLQRLAIASGDPRAYQLISWTSGSTQHFNGDLALPFLVLSLVLLGASLLFSRWLELFSLQAPMAQALGLNIARSRLLLILFSALLTALATLVIGPLSFIGLLVPHIVRFLGVHKARLQLLLSAVVGSLIMITADWIGRQILFPYEIPAGLVATLIGGTYFLGMVRRV